MNPATSSDREIGTAATTVRPGHVLEEAVDVGVTGTRIGAAVFIERLVTAPPGQVWFADGRNDLWGLPASAVATTRFVPEQRRDEELHRAEIPYKLPGRRRLYLEEELSPAVDNALIALVARGVMVRARYRGLLRSQINIVGEPREHSPTLAFIPRLDTRIDAWSIEFTRRSDEHVTADISSDPGRGLRLSHILVEAETDRAAIRTQRWLDLSTLSEQPQADLDELSRWLLAAEPGSDRFSTKRPSLDYGRPVSIATPAMTSRRPRSDTTFAGPSTQPSVREPIPKAHIDVLIAAGLYFRSEMPMDLVGIGRGLRRATDVGLTNSAATATDPDPVVTHISDLEPAAMIAAVASYLDRLTPGAATLPARAWCTGVLEAARSHSILYHEDTAEIIHATPQVISSLEQVPRRVLVAGVDTRVHYDHSPSGRRIALICTAPTTAAALQEAAAAIDWRNDNRWWDRTDTITAIVNEIVTATGTPRHVRTALRNLRDHHIARTPAMVGDLVIAHSLMGHWIVENITATGRAALRAVPGTGIDTRIVSDRYLLRGESVPLRELAVIQPSAVRSAAEEADTPQTFTVTWEIDGLDADDPEDAARQALRIQRAPDSTATVFTVTGPGGTTTVEVDPTVPDTTVPMDGSPIAVAALSMAATADGALRAGAPQPPRRRPPTAADHAETATTSPDNVPAVDTGSGP